MFVLTSAFLLGCTPPGPGAFFTGKRQLEKGDASAAIESFTVASSILPTNALVWHYLGLACQEAGRTAEADNAYHRALALNRDLTETHYNLGCLWLEHNNNTPDRLDLDRAKAEFTSFTLRRPNSVEGLVKLGTVQLRLRELANAEKSFSEALRLSSGNNEALNGLGLVRLERGRPLEAAQSFAAALKQRPDYAPALFNMAVLEHQYLRNRQAALEHYRQYLTLKPAPANAEAVAPVLRQLEKDIVSSAPATAMSKPVVSVATTGAPSAKPPSQPTIAAKSNVVSVAQTAASPAAKAPSSSTPSPQPTAATQLASPNKPPAETVKLGPEPAIKAANDTTTAPAQPREPVPSSQPSTPRYKYTSPPKPAAGNRTAAEKVFAQGLRAQGEQRLPEAQAAYRKAVQLDPAFFKAHYNLALAEADSGDTQAAMREYEMALAIQPDSLDARYNLGLLLKRAGFITDAVQELDKVAAAPNQARAHLALGNLYAQQLNDPNIARVHYSKVLELDPHHAQAPAIRYWLAANPR